VVRQSLPVRLVKIVIRYAYNFTASEAGWFACVIGASKGLPWVGPLVVIAFLSIHLRIVKRPKTEVRLIFSAVALGLLMDSLLVGSGWVSYPNGTWLTGFAPYWILAMWAIFATTLNTCMVWMRGRLVLAASLGAVFGPLAYLAGEEFGAITFHARVPAMLALGVIWAASMPLLVALAARWDVPDHTNRPVYIQDDWKVPPHA